LGHDPSLSFISVSYSMHLSLKFSRDFRKIIESDWYRELFPNVVWVRITDQEFETSQGGGRYATSVGGTITGLGADYTIVDDPQKPEDAYSKTSRENVNAFFSRTLYSRLND